MSDTIRKLPGCIMDLPYRLSDNGPQYRTTRAFAEVASAYLRYDIAQASFNVRMDFTAGIEILAALKDLVC